MCTHASVPWFYFSDNNKYNLENKYNLDRYKLIQALNNEQMLLHPIN